MVRVMQVTRRRRGGNTGEGAEATAKMATASKDTTSNEKMDESDGTPEKEQQEPAAKTFDLNSSFISCTICLEILYNPVNISPCNHKFCASCIYRWLSDNHKCPTCRHIVKEITADVFVAQICDEYLKANPDRGRGKESTEELDKAELEYLEKLIERSKASEHRDRDLLQEERDEGDIEIGDNFIDWIIGNMRFHVGSPDQPMHKLFLTTNRTFRENEWEQRSKRLREQLKLPPREFPIPPAPAQRHRCMVFHQAIMRLPPLEAPPIRRRQATRRVAPIPPNPAAAREQSNVARSERALRRNQQREEAAQQRDVEVVEDTPSEAQENPDVEIVLLP